MSNFEPPREEKFDKFISLIRAISSEIPGGNTLTELAFQFIKTPYQHRQDQWMEKVAKTLKELTESEGFRLEDTSTPWHLLILKFVASPRQWEEENKRKVSNVLGIHLYWVLEEAFPELKDNRDISQQVITDLWSKGLIETHPERETGIVKTPTLESIMKGNVTWSGRGILAILS
jgi:hypothetical protein